MVASAECADECAEVFVENAMSKRNGDDGSRTNFKKEKAAAKGRGMSDYAAAHIPDGSIIDFVFYEDFNSDNINEAVIGVTHFTPFPPESAVMMVQGTGKEFRHCWLTISDNKAVPEYSGLFDNASVADTDGDGEPELVLSLFYGQEHDITVFVFDWKDGELRQTWRTSSTYYHGSMETRDIDGDGVAEIIVETGTGLGSEIIETSDTCYRVREACGFKWDGKGYKKVPCPVRMPYESYNTAVDFLRAIWFKDYKKAFNMVIMPGFLGLAGLDDSSLAAFRNYVSKKIRPLMQENLSKGKLVPLEPYDTCCQFTGPEDCFTVELVRSDGKIKIYALDITKKSPSGS